MPYELNLKLLDTAFSGGMHDQNGKPVIFSSRDIGQVEIVSNRVAASDPLVCPNPEGFLHAVPNGRFPVHIAIAGMAGDERIAYAKVVFSPATPVRWEMALVDGQDLTTLESDQFFGYGVDAGTGCFMDPQTGKLLNARMDEEEDYFETIIEGMDATYAHTRSWLEFRPAPDSSLNIVCFSTGWGDGSYPSFFGLDAAGSPVVLVTDFLVVDSTTST